jgi:hypothetical protein
MRRPGRDATVLEDPEPPTVPEAVADPVARRVSPRDEHRTGAQLADLPRRPAQIFVRPDRHARDYRRLVKVRRHEVGERKEIPPQSAKTRGGEERGAARRDEDRVEDDVLRAMAAQAGRDRADGPGAPQHPDLHGVWAEIREDRVDLLGHEPG